MRAVSALSVAAALFAGACATPQGGGMIPGVHQLPTYQPATASQKALFDLPAPTRPVAVAVYGFTDQTGQFRASSTGQTLSRAVTQGGSSILMKALQDAGRRSWFTIVEREQVSHLLNERQIIREMRERYLGEQGVNPEALPALLFAGVILEGGVIGYDTNTVSGGSGAGFLGISARTEYRQDTVTVYLRAVSVRTGEVLTSVTASKTIASYALGAGAFRYVGFKELLEAEAGITTNEPDQMALQQAVEKAVYALVMEGAELNLWSFQNTSAAWPYQVQYQQERDGILTAEQVEAANERLRKAQQLAQADPPRMRPRGAPALAENAGIGQAGAQLASSSSAASGTAQVPAASLTRNLNAARAGGQ